MSSRTGRGRVVTLAAVGLGLVGAGSAWANGGMATAMDYPGLWPVLVITVIIVVETGVLRLVARMHWVPALAIALLANLVSASLAGGVTRPPEDISDVATLTLVSLVLETPVVLLLSPLAPRAGTLQGASRGRKLLWTVFALLLMNLVSAPIVPAFMQYLPRHQLMASSQPCLTHLKQLGIGFAMYQTDYHAWPPARNVEELRAPFAAYAKNQSLLSCPGIPRGKYFPLPPVPLEYACADFTRLPAQPPHPETVPLMWDSEPRHRGGYNVLYADGHAKWANAKVFQPPTTRGSAP